MQRPVPGRRLVVPLVMAAAHPATARVAGDHYPNEDMPSTYVLNAVGAAAAPTAFLRFVVLRARRGGADDGNAGKPAPRV